MTRMDTVPTDKPITLEPMKSFPLLKDLVTDVSWNYQINRMIPPFKPRPPDGTWRMSQEEVDRISSAFCARTPAMSCAIAIRNRARCLAGRAG